MITMACRGFTFLILFSLLCFLFISASPFDEHRALMNRHELRMQREARVAKINRAGGSWKAKLHPRFAELSNEEIRSQFLGLATDHEERGQEMLVNGSGKDVKGKRRKNTTTTTPRPLSTTTEHPHEPSFDAREDWPECADVIGKIQDQSGCASCWAVSSASVMQDRICIWSGGKKKIDLSAKELLACEPSSYGCDGGFPDKAFEFWQSDGVVTGSDYSVKKGCKPYPFPPHSREKYKTPKCKKHCDHWWNWFKYRWDKHYGKLATSIKGSDQTDIMDAILQGGPVVAAMIMYDDFIHYDSGVYEHGRNAQKLGGHAVRIIGWGVDEASGKPYWLAANSWNTDWGMDGYFKIVRGQDECFIESWLIAFADPKL